MKLVIDTLNRSASNMLSEKRNIRIALEALKEEIIEREKDLANIDVRLEEINLAISILEGSKNAITSKSKKAKSISSST